MKRIFAFLAVALAVSVSAKDIKVGDIVDIDDLSYEIISVSPAEAAVVSSPYAEGEIDILSEFVQYGVTVKVTKIAKMAFCNGTDENTKLKGTLTVPEGIREIEWQAFLGCNRLDSISLPSTLEKIGNSAFYCYQDKPSTLHAVRCAAVMPPACGEMVFGSRFNAQEGNNRDSIVLYVPVGSVEKYRAEKQWDYFNYIIDFEGQESSTVDEQHYDSDPDSDDPDDPDDPGEQGVDEVNASSKTLKYFENGQLVIEKNGVKFNVLGTQL